MFTRFRDHFGTAGLIVAVVALVAALTGGALAATGGSGGPKATASAKAKKGPRGPKGATGPAGPAGAQGPAGAKGDTGAGANGTSATTESFSGEAHGCKEGGVVVRSASPEAIVCDGKKGTNGLPGPPGPEGEPWTDGGTLPSEATETGAWNFGSLPAGAAPGPGGQGILTSISFPIPLGAAPAAHYINTSGEEVILSGASFSNVPQTSCDGTAAEPKADPGNLCVYETQVSGSTQSASQLIGDPAATGLPLSAGTAGKTGALMNSILLSPAGSTVFGFGTWAVSAA